MLNNKNNIYTNLQILGLSFDESRVYLALLDEPMTHLEIARRTGVNRTKVYRVADELEKRGLITQNQDDTGKQLAANNPSNLEIAIKTEETKIEAKKVILQRSLPALQYMFDSGQSPNDSDFEVNTYEGTDGFKQMLWNELETQKEILVFCRGTIQDLVNSVRWSEKHREKSLEAGYKIREIINPDGKPEEFTKNQQFLDEIYERRHIDNKILPIDHQICIYNNTVSIYNWQNNQKVGVEIRNKSFADMQRLVFEKFWEQAK